MRKIFFYNMIYFLIVSCGIKSYKLLDEVTKVPSDKNVYKNKSKFNEALLKIVDTSVVYEHVDRRYNALTRLDNHIENSVYGNYKFYSNGQLNYFVIRKNEVLDKNNFNPAYNGYRGVYYKEGDEIRYDFFGIANDWMKIGKLTATLTFKGDTLYIKRDKSRGYIDKYVKRKLPIEYLKYKADW